MPVSPSRARSLPTTRPRAVPRLKAAKFDEQMTLVEHLDELRNRIIVAAAVLVVACGLCFWQNHLLLDIANKPLPNDIHGHHIKPITFGVAEPFMSTLKISIYAGILIALPVLLYQLYAFFLPALKPTEKRVVLPFLLLVPFLFICGVVFSYFVVAPAAAKFLLNFNQDQFNIQVRASEYYGFLITILLAMGLVFQIPMGVVAVTRLGIVSVKQIAKNRRYAYLVLAVIAMLLPGTDPVTMLIELAPLLLLFEFSLILARIVTPPTEAKPAAAAEPEPPGSPAS
jgi:Tat protein translocase TatC